MSPRRFAFVFFVLSMALGIAVGVRVEPTWVVNEAVLDVQIDDDGSEYVTRRGKPSYLDHVVPFADAQLNPANLLPAVASGESVEVTEQMARRDGQIIQLSAATHWGIWSLLPAVVAVGLCLLTREPMTALLAGIVTGAFMLGQYDLTESVLIPSLASNSAAGLLLLYLWLLGGLLGVWSRTGAAQAFADFSTKHFVRGPRSAKFVAWMLGIVFFQGGTVSTVLVGTTVRPIADKSKVSHEELSYIVDSTASPIAGVLAFNAWPGYVQALIYLPGVAFLATEADRLAFFFGSVPLSFYCIFAALGTLLMCFDKAPFLGKSFRAAIKRARETGQLDAPGAQPLSSKELETSDVPEGYRPHVAEFFVPLIVLIGIAVGTFITQGSPQVRWAFGAALLVAAGTALARGMALGDLIDGIGQGLKGVVLASVILMLAVTVGGITQQTGGGVYLVDLLGNSLPFWTLPICLLLITMGIAFSTGTCWGTYAVAFPLSMPLAWSIAQSQQLEHPQLFLMICFATVMNGGIYGDQCSPISDTTVLSSMTTGADLMDHVRTQFIPATAAAVLAAILWTGMCLFIV